MGSRNLVYSVHIFAENRRRRPCTHKFVFPESLVDINTQAPSQCCKRNFHFDANITYNQLINLAGHTVLNFLNLQNLREHWQRMKEKYWGDWDEKLYKEPEKLERPAKKEKPKEDKKDDEENEKEEEEVKKE